MLDRRQDHVFCCDDNKHSTFLLSHASQTNIVSLIVLIIFLCNPRCIVSLYIVIYVIFEAMYISIHPLLSLALNQR